MTHTVPEIKEIRVNLFPRPSYIVYMGGGIVPYISSYYESYRKNKYDSAPVNVRGVYKARKIHKCAIITNATVASLYQSYIDAVKADLNISDNVIVHILPDGEKHKTVATWSGILDALISSGFDRKSVVVALGGGVVGDMAGFAAACFMRGIDFVQIPTTLLAMVDSSVGGKTAVDHPLGKNLIGAFHQPSFVLIDTDFLKTLPRREFVAGYAEMFKCAFIGGREMFSFIADNKGAILSAAPAPLLECIERCVRIKAKIVSEDEREAGARALLNFGHTFAHALERFYGFEGLLHGEAVLWGIVCAVELSVSMGLIARRDLADFTRILDGVPLPRLPSPPRADDIYDAMFADKKAEYGDLRFILPISPGESAVVGGVGEETVKEILKKKLHYP